MWAADAAPSNCPSRGYGLIAWYRRCGEAWLGPRVARGRSGCASNQARSRCGSRPQVGKRDCGRACASIGRRCSCRRHSSNTSLCTSWHTSATAPRANLLANARPGDAGLRRAEARASDARGRPLVRRHVVTAHAVWTEHSRPRRTSQPVSAVVSRSARARRRLLSQRPARLAGRAGRGLG